LVKNVCARYVPALRDALAAAGAGTGLTLTPMAVKPRNVGARDFPLLRKNAKTVVMPYGRDRRAGNPKT